MAIATSAEMRQPLPELPYLTVASSSDAPVAQSEEHVASVGLALAMATHPRLGAESPLSSLSDDLLRRIWITWALCSEEWLATVSCCADWCVRALDFCYVSPGWPSRVHELHGCGKGVRQENFYLSPGEHVVLARGWYSAGGDSAGSNVILYQLQLVTSTGRTSPLWGREGGRAFELLPWLPPSDADAAAAAIAIDAGTADAAGAAEPPARRLFEWLRAMRLVGSRLDGMDMDGVNVDAARRCVEHRSRGDMQWLHRPLATLNAQRAMLTRLDVRAGKANHLASKTGAVGHLVGLGVRAPPPSWESELVDLLMPAFAAAHAHARAHADAADGRDEGLAQRLFAHISARVGMMLLGGEGASAHVHG